jgi:hypothetical protein
MVGSPRSFCRRLAGGVWTVISWGCQSGSSVEIDKFVEVENHQAKEFEAAGGTDAVLVL